MIASRRTASAFVRLATTTRGPTAAAATRIAGASFGSRCSVGSRFRHEEAAAATQTQTRGEQRRTFLNQIMGMFGGDDDATAVTPESLVESVGGGEGAAVGNAVGDAMYALYTADAVCFDVDSTVINEEGIDVLADFLGKGDAVAELTAAAMEGGMKFDEALKARLDLLRPSRKEILDCLEAHPLVLTPGIADLVKALQSKNVPVFLVSGGFRIMIEPVADVLGIPSDTHLFANTINFKYGSDGEYDSFCADEPTSQDFGKPKALEVIRSDHPDLENLVMVGDGMTDAQAKPPAVAFIGFGGVVTRDPVKEEADWFVTDFSDMTKVVEMRS